MQNSYWVVTFFHEQLFNFVKFKVFIAMAVFWDVTCGLIDVYWHFRLMCCLLPRIFTLLVGICLIIQILTGLFLVMCYHLSTDTVSSSFTHISQDINWGWLRVLHGSVCHLYLCTYWMKNTYIMCCINVFAPNLNTKGTHKLILYSDIKSSISRPLTLRKNES
jgi:hypothetical protein